MAVVFERRSVCVVFWGGGSAVEAYVDLDLETGSCCVLRVGSMRSVDGDGVVVCDRV